ncbi:MAG TPA: IS630 family transposase [Acidobacteriota bacterium]|nr:IS630 family transposase [Acidobacteriota bacterium]
MWCLAELDADYIAKMEDVLALYEKPYNPCEPVVCLDEKPVSLHAEVRPPKAAAPGVAAKRDSEYKRQGTANVFCAVEPKAGRHFSYPTPRRSGAEFAQVLAKLAKAYPAAREIHLVVDNLNIHCRKSLISRFGEQAGGRLWDRFTLHYTPKHGSWLNQAEIEIGLFARQCLGSRRFEDLPTLRRETKAWNRRINRKRTTIQWSFTRLDARSAFHYQTNLFTRSEN